ncbi:MAG: acyltransferase [Alphaproteobacteria bacterium]|jgi:acetyltransferase-like isoleucine patch superfamily enzyme
MLEISPDARISPLADIEDSVRGSRIIIHPGVCIDSFVKFKPAGGMGDVVIGRGTTINSGCVLYTGNGITIGEHCAIAANCTFAPVNHAYQDSSRLIVEQGFQESRGGICIGNDVWIGANCVILDGAVIGAGAVIAAGTIVRDELPPYSVSRGIPATVTGYRS